MFQSSSSVKDRAIAACYEEVAVACHMAVSLKWNNPGHVKDTKKQKQDE